jgi:hypothetical protein
METYVTRATACAGVLLALLATAQGQTPPGLAQVHEFKDWAVACDNTRTCEAHGYHADDAELPAVLTLRRTAGAAGPMQWRVGFGDIGPSGTDAPVPKGPVELRVGTLRLALAAPDAKSGFITLTQEQAAALRPWLPRADALTLHAGSDTWTISLAGASAALLKIDDLQGRIGTTGALARPGTSAETAVPPALPLAQVRAQPVPAARAGDAALPPAIHRAIRISADTCPKFAAPGTAERGEIFRLDERHVLVVFECWLAAYNAGSAAWVANDKPPFAPVLARFAPLPGQPRDEGDDLPAFPTFERSAQGVLAVSSASKGRGIGDCWSRQAWVWDGRQFALTAAAVSPCRRFTLGGLELPLWQAQVR